MRLLLSLLLVLLAGSAPAAASAQYGFALRVTNPGLDELATAALPRLPTTVPVGPINRELYECSDGDLITAEVPAFDVGLNWRALALEAVDGSLEVQVTTDVDVNAPNIVLDNVLACAGRERCDLAVMLSNLSATVALGASTTPEGRIEFNGAMVDITIAPEDVALDSESCAVGDLAEVVFESLQDLAVNLVLPILEDTISEQIGLLLTEMFGDSVALSFELENLTLDAALSDLELTTSQGITMLGDGSLTWTGPLLRDREVPDFPEAEGTPLPFGYEGQFQVAASDRLVNEALFEAWRGGLLKQLIEAQALSFNLGSSAITNQIGLDGGARLDIGLDLAEPLVASFGRVAPNVTEIAIEGLTIQVDVTPDAGGTSRIDVGVDGTVAAALRIDRDLGGLVLEVDDLTIDELRIESENEDLRLDRARLASFITRTITPILSGALSGLPVAPSLNGFDGTFVDLRLTESVDGWQRIGADLHTPDPSDSTAPETQWTDAPTLVGAGTFAFVATGSDDSTPEGLLRFNAWLDGTPLNEEPSSVRTFRVSAEQGEHVIEVAAIDLNGNEDASRASHTFFVDSTPPELTLVEGPAGIIQTTFATATWTMSDSEGGVQASWELRRIEDDGSTVAVQVGPLSDATSHELTRLEGGELYEFEVTAVDDAGNVTSQTLGFGVDPSLASGCAVSPRDGRPSPLPVMWVLVVAGVVVWRRR
ncbi:MAG: hypothetical protein AB8I08_01680 [Sandaracinaceae bacterium]